jgi:hypothetical protein
MHGTRQRPQRPERRRQPGPQQAGPRRQTMPTGNARGKYERYLALAREATLNGDTIEAENCYQHAEHYFRVMRDLERR